MYLHKENKICYIYISNFETFSIKDIQTQWVHNAYRINFSLLSCSSGIEFKSFSVKVLQTFSYNFGKKPSGAFFSDSCKVTPDAIFATHLWNNYYERIVNSKRLWSIFLLMSSNFDTHNIIRCGYSYRDLCLTYYLNTVEHEVDWKWQLPCRCI